MRTSAQDYAAEGELQRLRPAAVGLFTGGGQAEDVPVGASVGIVLGEYARLVEGQRRQPDGAGEQGGRVDRGVEPAKGGQGVGSGTAALPHHVVAAVLDGLEAVGGIGQREVGEAYVQIGEAAQDREAHLAEGDVGVDIFGRVSVGEPGEHGGAQGQLHRRQQHGPDSDDPEQYLPSCLKSLLFAHDSDKHSKLAKVRARRTCPERNFAGGLLGPAPCHMGHSGRTENKNCGNRQAERQSPQS